MLLCRGCSPLRPVPSGARRGRARRPVRTEPSVAILIIKRKRVAPLLKCRMYSRYLYLVPAAVGHVGPI